MSRPLALLVLLGLAGLAAADYGRPWRRWRPPPPPPPKNGPGGLGPGPGVFLGLPGTACDNGECCCTCRVLRGLHMPRRRPPWRVVPPTTGARAAPLPPPASPGSRGRLTLRPHARSLRLPGAPGPKGAGQHHDQHRRWHQKLVLRHIFRCVHGFPFPALARPGLAQHAAPAASPAHTPGHPRRMLRAVMQVFKGTPTYIGALGTAVLTGIDGESTGRAGGGRGGQVATAQADSAGGAACAVQAPPAAPPALCSDATLRPSCSVRCSPALLTSGVRRAQPAVCRLHHCASQASSLRLPTIPRTKPTSCKRRAADAGARPLTADRSPGQRVCGAAWRALVPAPPRACAGRARRSPLGTRPSLPHRLC